MKTAFPIAALVAATAASMTLLPAPAEAQEERAGRVLVFCNNPCPRAKDGDEILICGRMPDAAGCAESEAFNLAVGVEVLEDVGRSGTHRCSTRGAGGFSGCWNDLARA